MRGRIRLAERRGLLVGKGASTAQSFGLELLMIEEDYTQSILRGQDLVNAVKVAIIAHEGKAAMFAAYPEWFVNVPQPEVITDMTDVDLEDTTGTWVFEDRIEKSEIEQVLASIGERMTVQAIPGQPRVRPLGEPDEDGWL